MNHETTAPHAQAARRAPAGAERAEREARRLLQEHAHDPVARLAIAADLLVRRLAHRIAGRLAE